jgi:hypothetical protein
MSEAVTDELVAQWYTTRKFRFSRGYHMVEEFLTNGPFEKAVRHSVSIKHIEIRIRSETSEEEYGAGYLQHLPLL